MKIIQSNEVKNNATSGMVTEMKKMFDEKLQNLEKENSLLKEQVIKKDKTENVQSEETLVDKYKKDKEGRKQKFDDEET